MEVEGEKEAITLLIEKGSKHQRYLLGFAAASVTLVTAMVAKIYSDARVRI